MKVLIVNKYENTGGAAIAAKRSFEALKNNNIDVKFLVQESSSEKTISTTKNYFKSKLNFIRFSFERLKILFNIKDKQNLYFFDSASFGEDISKHKAVIEADIIHLNWITFGFLSLNSLEKLIQLKKPIIWTMHDMWAITGGCFHSRGCTNYIDECKNCPFLKQNSSLALKIFNKKKNFLSNDNVYLIAISNWMKEKIIPAKLFKEKTIFELPNTIDTDFYKPISKQKAKTKLNWNSNIIHIGFAAFNVANKYKGGEYISKSIQILLKNYPDLQNRIELVAIGKIQKKNVFKNNIPIVYTGYINEEQKMLELYQAMDLFLMPSLEESLSLVTQEAMACETPVIAFNKGGQTDLIDHKINGYLADYKNSNDLANGIKFIIDEIQNENQFGKNARLKIVDNYSYPVLSKKLINIYTEIIKKNELTNENN